MTSAPRAPQLRAQLGADASARAGDDHSLARHRHARSPVFSQQRGELVVDVPVGGEHVREAGTEVQLAAVEVFDRAPASVISRLPAPTSHA